MASKFPAENDEKGPLRTRKCHDMTWSCDKHAEPISFYCKPHKMSACDRCAIKEHCKDPCQLKDIEDVISETRQQLDDLQPVLEKAKKRLISLDSKMGSSATSSSSHLQSVSYKVNATYEGKSKRVNDKEKEKITLINLEADEEIRIINEKREIRIKACKEEAGKQQQICKDIQTKLLSEIKKIDMTVGKKIEDLKSKNQHKINIMDNMGSKIERIKQNDKTLMNEAFQVIASLDESLSSNVHQEVADCLDRIESEVHRVTFLECEVDGKHYGRIDGYVGEWELAKKIDIPSIVNQPWVRGLISDDEICVLNGSDRALYVTNISTEHTEKVVEGDRNNRVTSCAPLDSNVIVCGKWRRYCRGDSTDRCITLYDRQWKVIRDITIPINTFSPLFNALYIGVDRDRMILAARNGQSNINVINPADGKIVNTIAMQDKKASRWNSVQALSSGDIVVKTGRNVFTVISQSGEEKANIHSDLWGQSRCYVDKLTDTLYITYDDEDRKVYAVDQVSCDGNIQARRIVEYKRSAYVSPCLVTPSGNLVFCDGDKLFLYKKAFLV